MSLLEEVKKYLKETPQKQLDENWEKFKYLNDVGPNVLDYYNNIKKSNQIIKTFNNRLKLEKYKRI